jgi:hypothetical protein
LAARAKHSVGRSPRYFCGLIRAAGVTDLGAAPWPVAGNQPSLRHGAGGLPGPRGPDREGRRANLAPSGENKLRIRNITDSKHYRRGLLSACIAQVDWRKIPDFPADDKKKATPLGVAKVQ